MSTLMVSSCSGVSKKTKEDVKNDLDLVDEALDATEINIEIGSDVEHLEMPEERECPELTRSVYDFGDFKDDIKFSIVDTTVQNKVPCVSPSDIYITEEDVDLYDNYDNHYDFKQFIEGYGESNLTIAKSLFDKDRVYYLELKNNDLAFKNKDADIKRLTFYSFDFDEDSQERDVKYKTDIPNLDINKVYYFDEDGYSPYFVYSDAEDLEGIAENQTFRVTHLNAANENGIEEDNRDTTYCKLLSTQKNPNGAGTMVRYQAARAEDIFDKFTIKQLKHIDDSDIIERFIDNPQVTNDIVQSMIHSQVVVTTMYGMMNYFGVNRSNYLKSMYDWGAKIDIKLDLDYNPSTATFSIGISGMYTFYPDNNIVISLKLGYTQSWRFDVTADASIATEFLIPVGVDYKIEVKEDTTRKIEFGVYIGFDGAGEYNEEATRKEVQKALTEARECGSNWQKKSVFKGAEPYQSKDGNYYPLFKISCVYFEPVEIYFEVDFYWELIPAAEFVVRYTCHTQRVDLAVSNKGGSSPSSQDDTEKSNEGLSFDLMGSIHAEVGFKLSIGISIIGLYKFFHLEVYLKIYGAIDIEGFISGNVTWSDTEPATAGMSLGVRLEISVGLKVGVDLYLLFGGINFEIPAVSVVLFGIGIDFPLQDFTKYEEDVYIKDTDYDSTNKHFNLKLGERHLLTVLYLNTKEFVSDIKDLEWTDKYKAVYGAFVPTDVELKMFQVYEYKTTEGELKSDFKITDDGYFGLESLDGQDNFTVEITIQTTRQVSLDRDLTKVIRVHFTNDNRQDIYVDGNHAGSFVNEAQFVLPVPDPIRYKKFVGYTWENNLGQTGTIDYDPTKLPSESLTITIDTQDETATRCDYTSVFVDDYHWEVYFVDGLNNIVKRELVHCDNPVATAPDPEVRDKYMLASPPDENHHYQFVRWDRTFDNITGPTVVRGIYKIVKNES